MLTKGPIPRLVHGLLEYLAGALLVAGPWLFDYDEGSATAVSIVAGVVLLAFAATTAGKPGLIDTIPLSVHATLDYVVAAVLIASPFVFGFSDDAEPTALFVVGGVVHVLVSIATRYTSAGSVDRPRSSSPGADPAAETIAS